MSPRLAPTRPCKSNLLKLKSLPPIRRRFKSSPPPSQALSFDPSPLETRSPIVCNPNNSTSSTRTINDASFQASSHISSSASASANASASRQSQVQVHRRDNAVQRDRKGKRRAL
ncbi:hypothetical protein BGZ81_003631 [Podila clonocystis]|nr:hypothetical protein BGZ81_003631 [Podila clonocystis]